MNIDFPYGFDTRGRTADTGTDDHVRDLIELFIFTSAGERVNRPEFGSGLVQLLFAPNSPELAATVRFTLQAGLQRWLGDVIDVRELTVSAQESTLTVDLTYVVRASGTQQTATFTRSV